jgi:hypothetical protein
VLLGGEGEREGPENININNSSPPGATHAENVENDIEAGTGGGGLDIKFLPSIYGKASGSKYYGAEQIKFHHGHGNHQNYFENTYFTDKPFLPGA